MFLFLELLFPIYEAFFTDLLRFVADSCCEDSPLVLTGLMK